MSIEDKHVPKNSHGPGSDGTLRDCFPLRNHWFLVGEFVSFWWGRYRLTLQDDVKMTGSSVCPDLTYGNDTKRLQDHVDS